MSGESEKRGIRKQICENKSHTSHASMFTDNQSQGSALSGIYQPTVQHTGIPSTRTTEAYWSQPTTKATHYNRAERGFPSTHSPLQLHKIEDTMNVCTVCTSDHNTLMKCPQFPNFIPGPGAHTLPNTVCSTCLKCVGDIKRCHRANPNYMCSHTKKHTLLCGKCPEHKA